MVEDQSQSLSLPEMNILEHHRERVQEQSSVSSGVHFDVHEVTRETFKKQLEQSDSSMFRNSAYDMINIPTSSR